MSANKDETFRRNIVEANAFWLSKPNSKDQKVIIDSNRNWKGNNLSFSQVHLLTGFRDKTNKTIRDQEEALVRISKECNMLADRVELLEKTLKEHRDENQLNHTKLSRKIEDSKNTLKRVTRAISGNFSMLDNFLRRSKLWLDLYPGDQSNRFNTTITREIG